MKTSWVRGLLLLCAVYDGVLGAAFLVAGPAIYRDVLKIPEPNHWGYIQFPAAVLIAFAIGFAIAARDPVRHRVMLWMGALLKVCYCAVVLGHWALGTMPLAWTLFAWIDLAFLAAFLAALRSTARGV